MRRSFAALALAGLWFSSAALLPTAAAAPYDVLIRGGLVFDGSDNKPRQADIAISGARIAAIGTFPAARANNTIDASGLAVSPGFINMLSWAGDTLLVDGASQSNIRQGVTLEVMGEGRSMGPLNDVLRADLRRRQGELEFAIPWQTLGEFFEHLQAQGVATNFASFVGATTLRAHTIGYANHVATPDQIIAMQDLVRAAMRQGALGVSSALIYAPGSFANTNELIALARVAGQYGGTYASHLRSEGARILEAVDELISVAREANVPAQIYHLKVSGAENWRKFPAVISKIEAARTAGTQVTANMYTYTAASTGLDAAMPPWVQAGGYSAWRERLLDPDIRRTVLAEMGSATPDWENLLRAAGPGGTRLVGFLNPQLRVYTGKTLAEVAAARNTSSAEAAIDLVIEDGSQVQAIYFLMSEEIVTQQITLPWMTFGSDAGSIAAADPFTRRSTHPRTYGNFARLLGRYVRERRVIPLHTAIHKLTGLSAAHLRIRERGRLLPGYFADIAIFDPDRVIDNATYDEPHRYASGMVHVLVNGTPVLKHGKPTGARPGRVVRGPGWTGWQAGTMKQ